MPKSYKLSVTSDAQYFSSPSDWFFEVSIRVDKYTLRVLMAIVDFQASDQGRYGNKPGKRKHKSALTDAGFEVDMPYSYFKKRKIDTRNIRRAFKNLSGLGILQFQDSNCTSSTHHDPYIHCRVSWMGLFNYTYWNKRNGIENTPVFEKNAVKNVNVPDDGVIENPFIYQEPEFIDEYVEEAAPVTQKQRTKHADFFEKRRLARLRLEEADRIKEQFRKANAFNQNRPLPPRLFDTPFSRQA